jgi:hypothetical protein
MAVMAENGMEKLKASGLIGGALVPISGSLAARYNGCLAMLGVKPTKLKSFSIDGMGWSPEISEEKNESYYLNIGEANSNAIIITPAQKDKPVHMPFHSFDRDVMTAIFAAYEREIRDITKDAAICVNLDQHMDAYYEPFDLLRFKEISVSFKLLNELDKKQKEQAQLILQFEEGNNFIDRKIHNKILESARNYGDLRHRKLILEPIKLPIKSFYTRAFGGIFVLRDWRNDIIVFEDMKVFENAIKDTVHDVSLFHISHNELMAALVNYQVTQFDIKKAAKTKRYERIKKHFFVEQLKSIDHPLHEILDKDTQKRIMSVELYNQRKIVERELKMDYVVDLSYTKSLLEPHANLEEEPRELVWKLLTKIAPTDPLHLYWYDKEQFYKAYGGWEPSYQEWVINCILENNENHSS